MKNFKSGLKGLFALLAIILAVSVNGIDSLFEDQTPDSSISIAANSSQAIEEGTQDAIPKSEPQESAEIITSSGVTEGQSYSTKDEVAAYIHQFNELPPNYLTKPKRWAGTTPKATCGKSRTGCPSAEIILEIAKDCSRSNRAGPITRPTSIMTAAIAERNASCIRMMA